MNVMPGSESMTPEDTKAIIDLAFERSQYLDAFPGSALTFVAWLWLTPEQRQEALDRVRLAKIDRAAAVGEARRKRQFRARKKSHG